jgi:hypothetical protein
MRINNQSSWIEPRFLLRGIMGALLAANLVAAVIAFKPFGGSADDLQRLVGRLGLGKAGQGASRGPGGPPYHAH